MKYYIYKLLDPETMDVRYVGKSVDPQKRFYAHIYDKSKSHKASWIKSLISKQMLPILEIVEGFDTEEDCFNAECFYIEKYRNDGANLTNLHNGGRGGSSEYVRGSKSGSAIVDEETVLMILNDLLEDKLYITDIARKYGVAKTLVYNIKRGVSWSHLTGISKENPFPKRECNKKNRKDTFKNSSYNDTISIQVEQYTLNGEFIKTHKSISEAVRESKEFRDKIEDCINGKISKTLKFLWKRKITN